MPAFLSKALIALSMSLTPPAIAQSTPTPPAGWDGFVRALEAYARRDSIVGGGALVLRGGRVLARHDFGTADRDRHQPVDERTLFHYASITKTFTAVAVMQLRDRSLLSLDDRVTKWIPELREVHDAYGSMDDVTIRMLLSHSSGLQNPTWPWRTGAPWEPFEPTRWEQLVAMMPWQELHFAPGSRFGYSNPGFIYLARIVELVSGDPYESYVRKNIWTPLGMTASYFGITPARLSAARSNRYTLTRDSGGRESVVAGGREFDPGITIPNSGWNAPLTDVATWVSFLTGSIANDAVLRHATLEEMWHPVVPVPPGDESYGDAMGLSFFLFNRAGTTLVGHYGDQGGFRSFFVLNPATSAAVIFVVNTSNEADPELSLHGLNTVREEALRLLAP